MKTRNVLFHMPHAMHNAWPWVVAIDAFDFDDREPLDKLLKSETVPEELFPVTAAIMRGDRTPNRKAAVKLKIPAAERMPIAATVSAMLGVIDFLKYEAQEIPVTLKTPAAERMEIADEFELIQFLRDAPASWRSEIVEKFGPFHFLACGDPKEPQGVSMFAERFGAVTPQQVKKDLEASAKEIYESVAEQWGVTCVTIKNLVRDLRHKIDAWPVV